MKFIGPTSEFFQLETGIEEVGQALVSSPPSSLTILWSTGPDNHLVIDGVETRVAVGEMLFLTEFHRVQTKKIEDIKMLRFNRSFYCILDHDIDVGCKGALFFGASQVPIVRIPEGQKQKFELLWQVIESELVSDDDLQIEMLQMLLKRFLILSLRIYKEQEDFPTQRKEVDMIREFNFLVESHFRVAHRLNDYAEMLHRSPKTISNIFSRMGEKTPLQYINDRILLEARRLLRHTDKTISQIGFEIGYADVQTFSRAFKNQQGESPTEYREATPFGGNRIRK